MRAHIRYAGTDTPLIVGAGSYRPPLKGQVKLASLQEMQQGFERAHKAQFGFIDRKKSLVIEAVSVEAVGGGATFKEKPRKTTRAKLPAPARRTRFFSGGKWHRALVYTREQLAPGHKVDGPAIIIEPHQTVVVEQGWRAELTPKNHLVLRRVKKLARARAIGTHADPVMLEVFNNLFMSIAEQMGVALQNTAYSVNIKERLDFSCAVFDGDGSLVANAPHMPVHLGSMDRAVETIIRENKGKVRPGDAYAINAPYNGGTHLPDITVCTPAFDGKKILFWVASRGHHADVGGISPGSMSPNATSIEQEGVYMDNFKLVDRGRFREKELYALLDRRQSIRRAIRCRTSTTSRRRSPPTRWACMNCARWFGISRCRSRAPICATSRTTPRKACGASSIGSTTAPSRSRPTRAIRSRSASPSTRRNARRPSILPVQARSSRRISTRRSR